jgi:hypothetical protein
MHLATLRLGGTKWIDGVYSDDRDTNVLCAKFASEGFTSKVKSFSIKMEEGCSSCIYKKMLNFGGTTILISLYSTKAEGDQPYSKAIFDEAKKRVDKRKYSDTLRHHFRGNEYLGYY